MSQNYTLEWATYNVHFNARGGSGTGNPAALGFYKYTGDAIPANKAFYVQ